MQSVLYLQNSLTELQEIINNTLEPVFTDLQTNSQVFDPIVDSHNTMIGKIDEMILFLNSGVIQGLKGDKGDQGVQGADGLSAYEVAVQNGFNGTVSDWLASFGNSPTIYKSRTSIIENPNQSYITIPELTTPLTTGMYEFELYGTYQTVATTTGIYFFVVAGAVPNKMFIESDIFPATGRQTAVAHQNEINGVSATITTLSVTTANASAPFKMSGKIIVSVDGDLRFDFATEIANSKVTINQCHLFIKKIS